MLQTIYTTEETVIEVIFHEILDPLCVRLPRFIGPRLMRMTSVTPYYELQSYFWHKNILQHSIQHLWVQVYLFSHSEVQVATDMLSSLKSRNRF